MKNYWVFWSDLSFSIHIHFPACIFFKVKKKWYDQGSGFADMRMTEKARLVTRIIHFTIFSIIFLYVIRIEVDNKCSMCSVKNVWKY